MSTCKWLLYRAYGRGANREMQADPLIIAFEKRSKVRWKLVSHMYCTQMHHSLHIQCCFSERGTQTLGLTDLTLWVERGMRSQDKAWVQAKKHTILTNREKLPTFVSSQKREDL